MIIMSYRLIGKTPVVDTFSPEIPGYVISDQRGDQERYHTAEKVRVFHKEQVTPSSYEAHSGSLGEKADNQPDDKRDY